MPNARSVPVGCFGKLPFWPEYLEFGMGYPTSSALKQWLHGGREELGLSSLSGGISQNGGRDSSLGDQKLEVDLRLLIGLPGSTELLAGVLRPSQGAGGRHFPFAVFAHVPRKTYGKRYELLPLAMVSVWAQLEEAWDTLASMASKDAFREVLTSLEIAPPLPLRQVQAEYQQFQQGSTEGLFARGDGASLGALNRNMPGILARLRRRGGGLALQLPVSSDLTEAGFDTSVWIDLLNRQFFLRRFDPNVIVDASRGTESRQVYLKFGALEPADYGPTMHLEGSDNVALRPAHEEPSPGGDSEPVMAALTYAHLLRSRFAGNR